MDKKLHGRKGGFREKVRRYTVSKNLGKRKIKRKKESFAFLTQASESWANVAEPRGDSQRLCWAGGSGSSQRLCWAGRDGG